MRLAWAFIKHAFIKSFEYRAEMLVWIFLESVPMVVFIMVWLGVYFGHDQLNGYTLSAMIEYYVLVLVLDAIVGNHFEQPRCEEVRLGKIDHFLTKPISYPKQIFLNQIGGKTQYLLLSLPVFALLYFILTQTIISNTVTLSTFTLASVLLMLAFGFALEFFLSLVIVFLAFWFEGAEGLKHFKWMLSGLFSGYLIPLAFMPEWLRSIIAVLPFRYLIAKPIEVLQARSSLSLIDALYMFGVVALLWAGSLTLWHFAKRKYASAGG